MKMFALALAALALVPRPEVSKMQLVYDVGASSPREVQEAFLEPLRRRAESAGMDPASLSTDGAGHLVVDTDPAQSGDWSELVERRGRVEFIAIAEARDLPEGVLAAERTAVTVLLQCRPDLDPALYRSIRPEAARLRWAIEHSERGRELLPLLIDEDPARRFTTGDLTDLERDVDSFGLPALRGRVARVDDFGAFTEELVGRRLAFLLDGEIVISPVVNDRLAGEFVISMGAHSPEKIEALIPLLLSGELPRVPVLVEVVGG